MYSNFNFLQNDWQGLAKIGEMAEYMLYKDPNTAIMKLRQFGEELINTMLKVENFTYDKNSLAVDRILILKRAGLIPADIDNILTSLRKKGNKAAHGSYGDEQTADILLSLAVKLGAWFQEVYGTDYLFQSESVEYKKPENIDYEKEYQRLVERTDEIEKELENIKTVPHLASREDRKKLISKKKEIEFTEEETRLIIDKQLADAGWEVDTKLLNYKLNKTLPEKKKNLAIAEWPCVKENGRKGFADYALFLGEKLYGILEAKRLNVDIPTALNVDSRIYAKGVEIFDNIKFCDGSPFGEYKVPFLFSSNGRGYNKDLPEKSGIWFLDARKESNLPKVLKGFYSPKDLKELLEKDEDIANQKLKEESFEYLESKIGLGLRYYQIDAIRSVEESLISGKKKVLLTMATGTGKTRTALGLIYRLLKTNKYKRILFVVDRTLLGEQAKETFDDVKLEQLLSLGGIFGVKGLNEKSSDKDERVHIATVQSLIKRILYPSDDEKEKLTVGEYDCIIVDEAHRGYILDRNMKEEERDFFDEKDFESKYRAVIDYFDAVKIALTATPVLHTQEIFGEPVYSYTCSQAVIDGYLVDAEPPYEIITKLSEEGIHYEKGAKVKVYDVETQSVKEREVLKDELDFDIEKFNKSVITEGFNREVCSALVDYINPEGPEKTLIFTASDEHADMVVRILKEEYQKQGIYDMNGDMILKMTGYVKDIDYLVKKFKNESYPTIGVTVDLLTTGVDVPKITNLVFLRKVKSRILYHQMLGRATRKCDEIDKTSYKVFDAVRNYLDMKDFSDMNPVVNNPQIDMTKLLESYNKDASDEGKKYFVEQIVARLQRKKKRIKDLGEDKFAINSKIYRKNEEIKTIDAYIEYIKNISPDNIENEVEFLTFLDSIQSPKKERIISEHCDEIRSVKQIYGNNEKPEDYLENFEKYIRENQDKLEALKLLKENPKLFKRKDLKELKYILDEEGYKETELNSAYGKVENVNITADILSYIKKVLKGSTILDKEEKIQDIEKRIKRLKNWNPVQLKIIEKIISQLRENSYLTEEDFKIGIFKDNFGGYNKINQKLEDKLGDIVSIINEEIILN
ncbi:type I restriction-modification system endonuclease [Fusobacterium polymorphum]|uniref:type I restriction-modification system endonuclease n=1 Tax=Fusobacterium nucleatum subsp. polymorphum TaxID=76857 RepID=UPI0030CA842C